MNPREDPALFPAFLKLAARKCLVVGAGRIGESKIAGLIPAGANITVVSPRATRAVESWASEGAIRWLERGFEAGDLDGIFLVVVATSLPDLNEAVFQEARRRGILCNVVDDPVRCDFYYPAVVRRGAFQIAISTNGRSPALAQRLRQEFETEFGPIYGPWVEELGTNREQLFREPMNPEERRRMLHEIASQREFEDFARRHRSRLPQLRNHSVSPSAVRHAGKDRT
jgi:precorrin-2 dehydrogenase / sirohydrochlorin ferrochelatase